MSHLVDVETLPLVELWGDKVLGRRVEGERITFALVELAPNAEVPGHRHEAEQLGMVIEGDLSFTLGDERRNLGPGGTWRIPSNVHHQVTAGPSGAIVIDVFSPVRSDWDGLPTRPARPSPGWPSGA